MSPKYLTALSKAFEQRLDLIGTTGRPTFDPRDWQYRPVTGGSINAAFQVTTANNKRWFCKFNDARKFPDLFATESRGLSLLADHNALRVPAVLACTEVAGVQVLVLEWIDQGHRSDGFWRRFGEELARLHRVTQPDCGLDHDNYMGALPQDNTPTRNWADFFRERRLQPQVRLARDKGLLTSEAARPFDRLYQRLPDLFPAEPPALLHGDCWAGNFLCDTAGQPVLIDPAVYFGHRSMDLAMTTLFGGFETAFYQAYHHHYPLPANYREQAEIANLYPLLIHLNLFGPGYLGNIVHTLQRF
jgi:protein-ribulosamine 3-kinase